MGRNNTQFFHVVKEQEYDVASILKDVYEELTKKGYNEVVVSYQNKYGKCSVNGFKKLFG